MSVYNNEFDCEEAYENLIACMRNIDNWKSFKGWTVISELVKNDKTVWDEKVLESIVDGSSLKNILTKSPAKATDILRRRRLIKSMMNTTIQGENGRERQRSKIQFKHLGKSYVGTTVIRSNEQGEELHQICNLADDEN